MKTILLAGVGGFIGSICRYKTGALFLHKLPSATFPWSTFTVNILGCFLVGVIAALLERAPAYNAELRIFFITGFLGGFTTFSAFGLETIQLLRTGSTALGFINVAASILLGLTAVWLGLRFVGQPG